MGTLFWICLITGALYALFSLLFGDLLGDALGGIDLPGFDLFKPVILAAAVTLFGGAGIMLVRYSSFAPVAVVLLALLIAVVGGMFVFFVYVKPMENSEVSTSYSIQEMIGRIGEVTIPVPQVGYGEVMIKLTGGNTLHIAYSFDRCALAAGMRVVIVEEQEGTLGVSLLEDSI